jgi:hypothetical protein
MSNFMNIVQRFFTCFMSTDRQTSWNNITLNTIACKSRCPWHYAVACSSYVSPCIDYCDYRKLELNTYAGGFCKWDIRLSDFRNNCRERNNYIPVNYWVFGLCAPSGILETRKHNVSETGSISETFCFLDSRMAGDGQSQKTQRFWVLCTIVRTL